MRLDKRKKNYPNLPNGEFAFVGWHEQQQTLTLITDPAGSRPLYYIAQHNQIAFATDIESLLPFCRDSSELDAASVEEFLVNGIRRAPDQSLVRGIKKAPPATRVQISRSKKLSRTYWRPENAPSLGKMSDEAYFQMGREILKSCIQDRLQANPNVAVHLSGGLDSSAIECRCILPSGES